MKPIKVIELSEVDRLKLEKGYHNGPTHSFRIRCKSILLKSEGKSAPQIAEMLEVTVPTVYTWVKRYEENGIKGLETRPGQGALRSAMYNTFIQTCKQVGVSFRQYFKALLKAVKFGRTDYENLLPMTISLE